MPSAGYDMDCELQAWLSLCGMLLRLLSNNLLSVLSMLVA